MSVSEAAKSQKWRAGSPTVVTYLHRVSAPPPDQDPTLFPVHDDPAGQSIGQCKGQSGGHFEGHGSRSSYW